MSTDEQHIASHGDPVRHQAAAWFARLLADDVSERERSQFQHWLADDSRHRAAYERLEVLWSGFGAHAGTPEIAAALRASGSKRQPAMGSWRPARRRAVAYGAAATLLLAVIAGGGITWRARQIVAHTYSTTTGEQRTLMLEDGSQVTMDTDTRLSTTYSPTIRGLKLEQGRAFFHVARNPNRPFLVSTTDGVVRAIGTQFDVYEHDNSTEVTLLEGRVAVAPNDTTSHRAATTAMVAGQRLLMGKGYPQPLLENAQIDTVTAWRSGKLVFDDTPLPAAIVEFNRYTANKIIIGDDALRGMRISGVFRTDGNRAFVDALRVSYGLSVTPDGTGDMVLAASKPERQERR